jgi:hypothetical protein
MSIRTTEELSNKLSEDLAWRKKEVSAIKSLVETRNFSTEKHNVLVRSGICILYSHWEGFIKLAANSYLEYIRSKKLTYKQLSSNFLALAMKEKLKEAKETNTALLIDMRYRISFSLLGLQAFMYLMRVKYAVNHHCIYLFANFFFLI